MASASTSDPSGLCIGIDLGTTFSCVAVYQHGMASVVPNQGGGRTTPSYVAFTDTDVLVGENAVENRKFDMRRTFHDCKRLIGRRADDKVLLQDLSSWGFDVFSTDNKPQFKVQCKGQEFLLSPTHVGAIILRSLKTAVELATHQLVDEAVITVPAYFSNSQRASTKMAGKSDYNLAPLLRPQTFASGKREIQQEGYRGVIAGLSVSQIVNEPTAAAVAYCCDNGVREDSLILVFDLGGGTFDVSLVDADYDAEKDLLYLMVKASSGHGHLGGLDFTEMMRTLLVQKFLEQCPECDVILDKEAMDILLSEAEKVKRMLSSQRFVRIKVRKLFNGLDLDCAVSVEEFEAISSALMAKTLTITHDLLKSCKIKADHVKNVILVGGSTRMPAVRKNLQTLFHQNTIIAINADEDVARGAALLACTNKFKGGTPNIMLRDVTPIPLGIAAFDEEVGYHFTTIVDKYTMLPHRKVLKNAYTRAAETTGTKFTVLEGFSSNVDENTVIGEFKLQHLQEFPDKSPLEIEFDLDENGLLKVNVKDVRTGVGIEEAMQVGDVEFTPDKLWKQKELVDSMFAFV